MKNYLKYVGFTILVTCFIATIFTTISYFAESFYADAFDKIYYYSIDSGERIESLVETGKSMEESFVNADAKIQEQKELFGEDYPALGIFLHRLLFVSGGEVAYVNIFAILIGFVYGTIFYIFAVQKAKGKKLILELGATLFGTLAVIQIDIFIYGAVLNKMVSEAINNKIAIPNEINVVVPFIGLFILTVLIVAVGNRIYQAVMTKKLNKELQEQNVEK